MQYIHSNTAAILPALCLNKFSLSEVTLSSANYSVLRDEGSMLLFLVVLYDLRANHLTKATNFTHKPCTSEYCRNLDVS